VSYRSRFFSAYLDPVVAKEQIAALVREYPALCRLETLPHRTHGYWGDRVEVHGRQEMVALHITAAPDPAQVPAVLVMRSHHAREWINTIAVLELAYQLAENYRPSDPDPRVQQIVQLLDRVAFIVVPESNPDGALRTFFDAGSRMWRKNLRPAVGGGCVGVDCNRNYPVYFGEAGSSPDACTEIAHGPTALSEPESANIADLVNRYRNIVFAIDSHSSGEKIFRPTAAGGTYTPSLPVKEADEANYRILEAAMNRAIRTVKGIQYGVGSTSNHAGTTDEFLFFAQAVYGFDLECGTEFQPPISEALASAQEVVQASLAVGQVALGGAGIDVAALLARRRDLVVPDFALPRVGTVDLTFDQAVAATRSWSPLDQRRFFARLGALGSVLTDAEVLSLLQQGFDVDEDARPGPRLIVSPNDITRLLALGYQVTVVSQAEQ
jgi:hypothetical protein